MKKKGVFVDCLEPEVEKFIFENPMIKEIIELLCKHFKNKNEQSHLLKLIKRLIEDEKRRLYKYFFELKFIEPKDDGKVENILFNKIQAILNKEGEVCGFKIHKTLITMFINDFFNYYYECQPSKINFSKNENTDIYLPFCHFRSKDGVLMFVFVDCLYEKQYKNEDLFSFSLNEEENTFEFRMSGIFYKVFENFQEEISKEKK